MNFKSVQSFTIPSRGTFYSQDISQETNVESTTTTRQGHVSVAGDIVLSLAVNYSQTFELDGSVTQVSNTSQECKKDL